MNNDMNDLNYDNDISAIIIKIDEIENNIECIYKFNKENNNTIANLLKNEKNKRQKYIEILSNYIKNNDDELYTIKLLIFNIYVVIILLFIIKIKNIYLNNHLIP